MGTKTRWILFIPFLLFLGSGIARGAPNYPDYGYRDAGAKLPPSELKKLVAPIALYPDPLLAQVLPASTYPLEIVEAGKMIRGPKDYAKIDAQNWDPSVKAVAHYPEVLKMMSDRLDWTQALGQAVLNQQQDVLQAVQEMRREAQAAGNLKSNPHQKIRRSGDFVEILPVEAGLVYAPVYDPELVYAAPAVVSFFPPLGFSIGVGPVWFTSFYWPSYSLVYADAYYPWWSWRYVWPWWRWSEWNGGWYGWRGWPGAPFHINNVSITNFSHMTWSHDDRHGNPFNGRIGPSNFSSKEGFRGFRDRLASQPRNSLQKFSSPAEGIKGAKERGQADRAGTWMRPSQPEFRGQTAAIPGNQGRHENRSVGVASKASPMFRNLPNQGGGHAVSMSRTQGHGGHPALDNHGSFGGGRRH